MSALRTWLAEHRRTGVRLSLPELTTVLMACEAAEPGSGWLFRRQDPDLASARRRLGRARERRVKAVERAAGH